MNEQPLLENEAHRQGEWWREMDGYRFCLGRVVNEEGGWEF